MFSVHCEDCGTTHLYGPRRIVGMVNTDAGIIVSFRCFCGGTASVLTGRAAAEAPATVPADERVAVVTPATGHTTGHTAGHTIGHTADERELVGCGSSTAA